jgi:hypothetical protein
MAKQKRPGETWSLTDVASAAGRSLSSVRALVPRILPAELLEERAGRGAAVQLPEDVALALVAALRFGVLDSRVIAAMQEDPAAVIATADGLAELARMFATTTANRAA